MSRPSGKLESFPIPNVLNAKDGLCIEPKEAALRGTEPYIWFGPNENCPWGRGDGGSCCWNWVFSADPYEFIFLRLSSPTGLVGCMKEP